MAQSQKHDSPGTSLHERPPCERSVGPALFGLRLGIRCHEDQAVATLAVVIRCTGRACRLIRKATTTARAALAGSLLESLDTEVDEDAEAAWATEVSRRVAELDSGAVKTAPWAEVRRRLAER